MDKATTTTEQVIYFLHNRGIIFLYPKGEFSASRGILIHSHQFLLNRGIIITMTNMSRLPEGYLKVLKDASADKAKVPTPGQKGKSTPKSQTPKSETSKTYAAMSTGGSSKAMLKPQPKGKHHKLIPLLELSQFRLKKRHQLWYLTLNPGNHRLHLKL